MVPIAAIKMRTLHSGWLYVACLVHAVLITVLWVLDFRFNVHILSSKVWLGLALMWMLWLPVASLFGLRNLKKWLITGAAGFLILLPTYSTIYTFTVWAVEGFAP